MESGLADQSDTREAAKPDILSSAIAVEPETADASFLTPLGVGKRGRLTVSIGFAVILAGVYFWASMGRQFLSITDTAMEAGAFFWPLVQTGEWWRFVTATVLHANPGHLLNNVAGILIFGNLLEPVLGKRWLLTLYTLSMLLGLGLSAFINPHAATIGASTIDFGLVGAYMTLILLMRFRHARAKFAQEARGAFLFVLIFVIWNALEGAHINLWGHIGGLLAGILVASVVFFTRQNKLQG